LEDTFRDDWSPLMGYPASYILRFKRNANSEIAGLLLSGNGCATCDLIDYRCYVRYPFHPIHAKPSRRAFMPTGWNREYCDIER